MPLDAKSLQITTRPGAIEFGVKVVPGASRDAIVGVLGVALKVAVSAPPEAGKANAAVIRILAEALRIPDSNVAIASGATQPRKRVQVIGVTEKDFRDRIVKLGGK